MGFLFFFISVPLLAVSLLHYDPLKQGRSSPDSHTLPLLGIVAHIAGALSIGWVDGAALGAVAFFAIPVTASVCYSLIVVPIARSRRLREHRLIAHPHPR